MKNISLQRLAFLVLVCAATWVNASPLNKCVINGAVVYQQTPCPSIQARKEPTLEERNAGEKKRRAAVASAATASPKAVTSSPTAASSKFSCDSRQYCSQMKSCEEAKYFLEHCPSAKMDGDRNGVPCEKQWCSR